MEYLKPGNEIYDPEFQELPTEIEISQPMNVSAQWQTPGLYIAQRIFQDPLIRFIGEKYERDCLLTIIVLDSDPEQLLNKIFSIEQEMFKIFDGLRFDIRVRVIPLSEEISLIKKSTVAHFNRN